MKIQNKRFAGIIFTASLLLIIPLISMQFTDEVNWSLFDFFAAGVLLFGTGISCELVIRKVKKINYRIAICLVFLLLFVIIWTQLAVGIFGTLLGGT